MARQSPHRSRRTDYSVATDAEAKRTYRARKIEFEIESSDPTTVRITPSAKALINDLLPVAICSTRHLLEKANQDVKESVIFDLLEHALASLRTAQDLYEAMFRGDRKQQSQLIVRAGSITINTRSPFLLQNPN
jgi:hypothetical protein